jgi:hypothetical protein
MLRLTFCAVAMLSLVSSPPWSRGVGRAGSDLPATHLLLNKADGCCSLTSQGRSRDRWSRSKCSPLGGLILPSNCEALQMSTRINDAFQLARTAPIPSSGNRDRGLDDALHNERAVRGVDRLRA